MANETVLTNKIFLNAVLPLVKVIATDVPSLAKKFEHMHAVFQVSALDPESPAGKVATHFTVNNGEWRVCADKVATNAFVDLEFKSLEAMNAFFKGKIAPSTLPKMKGAVRYPKVFAALLATLLKMSALLSAKEAPENEDDKHLMVKFSSTFFRRASASSISRAMRRYMTGRSRAPTAFMPGQLTVTPKFQLI